MQKLGWRYLLIVGSFAALHDLQQKDIIGIVNILWKSSITRQIAELHIWDEEQPPIYLCSSKTCSELIEFGRETTKLFFFIPTTHQKILSDLFEEFISRGELKGKLFCPLKSEQNFTFARHAALCPRDQNLQRNTSKNQILIQFGPLQNFGVIAPQGYIFMLSHCQIQILR